MLKVNLPLVSSGNGRYEMVQRITQCFPQHDKFVHVCGGPPGVMLMSSRAGRLEVINDMDRDAANFLGFVQDAQAREMFPSYVYHTPLSFRKFEDAHTAVLHYAQQDSGAWAAAYFAVSQEYLVAVVNDQVVEPVTLDAGNSHERSDDSRIVAEQILTLEKRLSPVKIVKEQVVDVITQEDGAGTLFYLEPPCLDDAWPDRQAYVNGEKPDLRQGHAEVLDKLCKVKGSVVFCGNDDAMTDDTLKGWHKQLIVVPNVLEEGPTDLHMKDMWKNVWTNFDPKC